MSSIKNIINDATTGVKHGMHSTTHHPVQHEYTYTTAPHHHTSHGHTTAVVSTGSQVTRKVSEVIVGEQFRMPTNAYEQSRRQVSSVILYEEEDKIPARNVRYVEVPQYEEVVKHVVVKEIREVEKVVPKIVEEWVERIVEVPQIEEVVRHVEVPQVQEVIKHVPKIEIHDRHYDVVKNVPKIHIQKVEKVVDVATETVEVPKAVLVEERVHVDKSVDTDAMLIVSQKVKPVIVEGGRDVVVDVIEYEPEVMPVDIHVAKFVDQELVMMGAKETIHRVVTVGAAQYNSMLRFLNIHLTDAEIKNLPYLMDSNGQVSFLPQDYEWQAPAEGLKIFGYRAGQIYGQGTPVVTKHHGMTEAEINARQAELDRQFNQIFRQFESEKHRRIQLVEEFNRHQDERVRMMMVEENTHLNTAIGHTTYHSTIRSTATPSNRGSITYSVGHAAGSAQATRH